MNLLKLKLKNFFSYKDAIISFKENGIYLVYGFNKQTGEANGVGKSIIKEGITFGNYGKCRVSDIDKTIHFNTQEMSVEEIFESNNVIYKIVRSRIKYTKSLLKFYKLTNNVEIDLTCDKIKDTQILINQKLGLNYEQFMYSFCFGQSIFDNLSNITGSKLIDFLKSSLDLERFDKYFNKIKLMQNKNEDMLNKFLGIKEVHNKLVNLNINKKEVKKQLTVISNQLEELKNNADSSASDLTCCTDTINVIMLQLVNTKRDFNKLKNDYTYANNRGQCPLCKTNLKDSKLIEELKQKILELNNIVINTNTKYEKLQKVKEGTQVIFDKNYNKFIQAQKLFNELNIKMTFFEQHENLKFDNKAYEKALYTKGILAKSLDIFNSKGLPLFLLERYIPKLEYVINQQLETLSDFRVELRTKEKLKSSNKLKEACKFVVCRAGKEYMLENLSNGEKFLITLGVRIGLSKLYRTNVKFNTLIIDEGFGQLGDINKDKVLELLTGLTQVFQKIILISHVESIRNWGAPKKLEILKDGLVSTIV